MNRTASLPQSRKESQTFKRNIWFGTELPKAVEQALVLDAKNGNTFWADAIIREMEHIRVTFKILLDGVKAPIGHLAL